MPTTIPSPSPGRPLFGTPSIPTEHDIRLAKSSLAQGELVGVTGDVTVTISGDQTSTGAMRLPGAAVRLLFAALAEMARGNGVSLLPLEAELRTQEAADMLHVSRPYLVGLLEKGEMPFRLVGNQRRVRLRDLMNYKARSDIDRRAALDELGALGQEIGVGYEHDA